MFRPGLPGFTQGRSCLTSLIILYDEVTCLVDEGKALDIVYLDFSKAFCDIQPLRGEDHPRFVNACGGNVQQKSEDLKKNHKVLLVNYIAVMEISILVPDLQ